jgi:hypothetical protein
LRAQLNQPGDISAVIEMPGSFLLFVAKEKNAQTWTTTELSLPKKSYSTWLNDQEKDIEEF